MISEIIPFVYDANGKSTLAVSKRHKRLFHRTFPMGRYVSQPLSKQCLSIDQMREFLSECEYLSDKEQFNQKDYWMPPEEFEKTKKGDCEDFALWTWRQFLSMGYKARYVIGSAGLIGTGHAWVTIEIDGKHFIVEPQVGSHETLPRLSMISYRPRGSVGWDGKHLRYFVHKKPESSVSLWEFIALMCEWLWFWAKCWLIMPFKLFVSPYLWLKKLLKK